MNEKFYRFINTIKQRLAFHILPIVVLFVLNILIFGSLIIFLTERHHNPRINNYFDAIWCALGPLGYSNIYPETAIGRVLCVVELIAGVGLISTLTATIASFFIERFMRGGMGMIDIKWGGHILICGWNEKAPYIISELEREMGEKKQSIVLLADIERKPPDVDVFFVRGDSDRVNDLERANIKEAASVIILADQTVSCEADEMDARTVLTALAIRSMRPEIKIIAEVVDPRNVEHLKRVNIDEIVVSSIIIGNLLARTSLFHGMSGIINEIMTAEYGNQLYKITLPSKYVGNDYNSVLQDLQAEHGVTLIGVERNGEVLTNEPRFKFDKSDSIFVLAKARPNIE